MLKFMAKRRSHKIPKGKLASLKFGESLYVKGYKLKTAIDLRYEYKHHFHLEILKVSSGIVLTKINMNETSTTKKYPTVEKALSFMKMFISNELYNEAIDITKEWPELVAALPDSLKARLLPPKVTSKTPTSINIDIHLSKIVSIDDSIIELKKKIKILAPLDDAILICGETGTGKELVAKSLHGSRPIDKFIPLNCAGLPEYLIESELFGHKKGAFTGADTDKKGLMEEANDGTFFLDEIGELPIGVQAKFLRALQEKLVRPVGSNIERRVTCRIIAASHHDLDKLVSLKLFREDLYARLRTFELIIKPLRERLEDISEIIKVLDPDSSNHEMWNKVNWKTINLKHNYRALQSIVRRWIVFKEEPK